MTKRSGKLFSSSMGYGRTFYADEVEDLAYLKRLAKETRGDENRWPELNLRIRGCPKKAPTHLFAIRSESMTTSKTMIPVNAGMECVGLSDKHHDFQVLKVTWQKPNLMSGRFVNLEYSKERLVCRKCGEIFDAFPGIDGMQ